MQRVCRCARDLLIRVKSGQRMDGLCITNLCLALLPYTCVSTAMPGVKVT